jgi:uncharacterized repeat protein (TIGR03803 family)
VAGASASFWSRLRKKDETRYSLSDFFQQKKYRWEDRVMRSPLLVKVSVLVAAVLGVASLALGSGADAVAAETVLYSFKGGQDGGNPVAGLIMDSAGRLYGTTYAGGMENGNCYGGPPPGNGNACGVVFALTPNAARTTWTETVLYSFCAQGGCDGTNPAAGLIKDSAGRLYGTTDFTVFELTPNAAKTKWTETVLYSFCAQSGCTDGAGPQAGLIMEAAGRLYGTTENGGAYGSYGTVFELTPNAAKTKWTESVLYSFKGGQDGDAPVAGLIIDAGHLYGTTLRGGAYGHGTVFGGTVFELTPNAAKTKWTETVLYSFCAQSGCTDGEFPQAGLMMDSAGRLYGTTNLGGAYGYGTVFELTPNAAKTKCRTSPLDLGCCE